MSYIAYGHSWLPTQNLDMGLHSMYASYFLRLSKGRQYDEYPLDHVNEELTSVPVHMLRDTNVDSS